MRRQDYVSSSMGPQEVRHPSQDRIRSPSRHPLSDKDSYGSRSMGGRGIPGPIYARIPKTGSCFWFFVARFVHRTEKTRNMQLFCRNRRILRSSDLHYSGLLLARVSSPVDYEVAGGQRPTDAVCDRMVGSSRRTGFYVNREFSRRVVIRDRIFAV